MDSKQLNVKLQSIPTILRILMRKKINPVDIY